MSVRNARVRRKEQTWKGCSLATLNLQVRYIFKHTLKFCHIAINLISRLSGHLIYQLHNFIKISVIKSLNGSRPGYTQPFIFSLIFDPNLPYIMGCHSSNRQFTIFLLIRNGHHWVSDFAHFMICSSSQTTTPYKLYPAKRGEFSIFIRDQISLRLSVYLSVTYHRDQTQQF